MKLRLLFSTVAIAALMSATGASAQGWYVSLLGGATLNTPRVNIGGTDDVGHRGFNAGGRLGYSLDAWLPVSGFALEADVFYNQAHLSGSTALRRDSISYMGNLMYRVNAGWIGVYGGGGAGAVRTELDAGASQDASTAFGWQAIGGIDHHLTPEAKIFAEYRYQNAHAANLSIPVPTRVSNTTNNISVGVRFDL